MPSNPSELLAAQERRLARAFSTPPLALAKWWGDGTLVFAAHEGFERLGVDLRAGLATPYQQHFAHAPEVIDAIGQAFDGRVVAETVRVNDQLCDVRFFPAYGSDKKLAGVIGILTDASDRVTAFRLIRTLEVLSLIRRHLARSDSLEEFLRRACEAIEEVHAAVWIGLADHSERKALRVLTGRSSMTAYLEQVDLTWDIAQKSGQHLAAEAVRTGRTQLVVEILSSRDCEVWHAGARDYGWKSLLAVPLLREGASLGVLAVHSTEAVGFDQQLIGLWENIAGEIAEGIGLLEARRERTRILLERQELDERYKQLVETVFDVIVVHSNGKILEINPAGVRVAGARTREELIGTPVIALVHPDYRARVSASFRALGDRKPAEMAEFKLLGLNSSVIDVEGVTVPVRHGKARAQLSVLRDISQRKLHDQLVSKAKASLEYAQQIARMGSAELDVASGTAEWSTNALAIMDLDDSVRQRPFIEVISERLLEESRQAVTDLLARICATATADSAEVPVVTRAGGRHALKTIQIHGTPIVSERACVPRVFFVIRDITEFREIERGLKVTTERLLRAQAIGRIGDFEMAPDEERVSLSQSACRLLGLGAGQGEMAMETFYRQIHADDRATVRRDLANLFAAMDGAGTDGPQPVPGASLRMQPLDCRVGSDDGRQWINLQAEVVTDQPQKRIVGNIQDITARKLAELEVTKARQKLEISQHLSRVWEWQLDLESNVLRWSDSVRDLLGFDSPIKHMTFEQFLGSIREVDVEPMRLAVENTVKHGVPGEVVYVQKFLSGISLRLYSRWVGARNEDGKIVRLMGTSLDVTSIKEAHEREQRGDRIHRQSGIAEREMVYDRLHYLTHKVQCAGIPFAILGFKVQGYRAAKQRMGDASFYEAQREVARALASGSPRIDTFARLGKGRFVLVVVDEPRRQLTTAIAQTFEKVWENSFIEHGHPRDQPMPLVSCVVCCPRDGIEWEGLLKLVEFRLGD